MTITTTQEGAHITLAIDGRVDTNTSPQLQNEILKAFQSAKELTLESAATMTSIPLHPGAERFFSEKGLID